MNIKVRPELDLQEVEVVNASREHCYGEREWRNRAYIRPRMDRGTRTRRSGTASRSPPRTDQTPIALAKPPPLLSSGHIHGRQRSLLQDQANDQAQQAEERVRRTSGQASDVYPVSSLLVLIRLLAAHHVFAGAGSSMTAVGSRMRIRPSRWSWRTEMRSRCSLNVRPEPPLVSLFPAYSSGVSGRGRRCAVRECGVKRCTMMERGCMTMQCHLSELARGWSGLHSSGRAMASGGGIGRPLLTGGVIGPMTSSSNGKRGFSWKH